MKKAIGVISIIVVAASVVAHWAIAERYYNSRDKYVVDSQQDYPQPNGWSVRIVEKRDRSDYVQCPIYELALVHSNGEDALTLLEVASALTGNSAELTYSGTQGGIVSVDTPDGPILILMPRVAVPKVLNRGELSTYWQGMNDSDRDWQLACLSAAASSRDRVQQDEKVLVEALCKDPNARVREAARKLLRVISQQSQGDKKTKDVVAP